jgi:hypothetical protein
MSSSAASRLASSRALSGKQQLDQDRPARARPDRTRSARACRASTEAATAAHRSSSRGSTTALKQTKQIGPPGEIILSNLARKVPAIAG